MIILIVVWTFFVSGLAIDMEDYRSCKKIDFKDEKCEKMHSYKKYVEDEQSGR